MPTYLFASKLGKFYKVIGSYGKKQYSNCNKILFSPGVMQYCVVNIICAVIGQYKQLMAEKIGNIVVPCVGDDVPEEYREDVKALIGKIANHMKTKGHPYEWSLKDFQIGAPMGRGKFGRVYLAREKDTHYMVALKMLFKSELVRNGMQHQVLREIEIQTHLNHPNILRLLTYFSDEKHIFLVLEFAANGELYRHMQSQPGGHFDEKTAAKYIEQVSDAIDYCHKYKVMHRDIKPENILLTSDGNIKLADFGWSVHAPSSLRKTMCGTVDYLPPEMIENKVYNENVDHWCIGVLCYEFLVGKPPFESNNQHSTFEKIRKVAIHYPSHVSSGAKDLISKLLKHNPTQRMPLREVKSHPWIIAMRQQ